MDSKKGRSDELYNDAVDHVRSEVAIQCVQLQREFNIGYARAHRLIDQMIADGILQDGYIRYRGWLLAEPET